MSGIVGKIRFTENISQNIGEIQKMTDCLNKRGPEQNGIYTDDNCILGQTCNEKVEEAKIPLEIIYDDVKYVVLFDGKIYNNKEIKDDLIQNGFEIETNLDAELIVKSYIFYGKDICKNINGVFAFAIWNSKKKEMFIARDHFGIKPVYFSKVEDNFIFASEIKGIFESSNIKPELSEDGIAELFGIGPAHSPGMSPFKDIEELKPAHFLVYNENYLLIDEYWKLETHRHKDDLDTTAEKIRFLLRDSIEKQIGDNENMISLLSGGIDSSIITAYSSKIFEEKFGKKLNTFSVDYVDNDKNFVKNDFQPNQDEYFIKLMSEKYNTNHEKIMLDSPELFESLKDAMIARDFPGMADVDSSYLLLFKKLKEKGVNVALSGECSDEIFGGYPWYFRNDALESNTFPWSIAINERQNLLNPKIAKNINLKEYIDKKYNESLSNVEFLESDSNSTVQARKLIYLTSNWFMQTLLDRTDRMCMYSGLDVRVPFCDYRIVEYVWNIPWEMKAYNGREKGLLRYAMKDILPEEIVERKKSPYPKTFNPEYTKFVKDELTQIMNNEKSPIIKLLNKEYILEIIETNGSAFTRPWFGQLMTGPQLMAYLIQVNMWLEQIKF